jgi:hypothetical protein
VPAERRFILSVVITGFIATMDAEGKKKRDKEKDFLTLIFSAT